MIRSTVLALFLLLEGFSLALYDHVDSITLFSDNSQLSNKLQKSDEMWVVHYYDPSVSASTKLSSDFIKVSEVLKGVIQFGAIDITASTSPHATPSVKIHPLDKSRPVLDISQKVSVLTDLIQEVMSELSNNINERLKPYLGGSTKDTFTSSDNGTKSAMLSLNGRNFEDLVLKSPDVVLVAFVAPWCGHCKRLLPEWEEAAKRLQGSGAILGVVDATIEKGLATEWGIKSYPTIKAFPGGPKTVKSAIHYEDGRVADQIVDYALNLVDSTGIQTDKVPQLISREMLSKECNQPGRVCIISGLPHILESGAEGRNTYKDVIKNATKAARGLNFKFLWFEGSAQPALEQALEMTNGFPAVVAIRMDKSVYSVQRTAFSESHIRKFITGLTMGKEPTFPLQSMPEILSTEAWDGKDAERYEDEPLDDIMNDEF